MKVSKFRRSNGYFDMESSKLGECATIDVLHPNLLFYTEHKFRVDGRFCDLVLEMFKADLH